MALGAAGNLAEGVDSLREELRIQYEERVSNTLKCYPEDGVPPAFGHLVLEEPILQAIQHMSKPALLLYKNRSPQDIAGQLGCKRDFGTPFVVGGFLVNASLFDRGRVTGGSPVYVYERELPHGPVVSYYPRRTSEQMYDGKWRAQVADAGNGECVFFGDPAAVLTRRNLDFFASHKLLDQGLQPMGDLADYLELVKSCRANGEKIDEGVENFTALGGVMGKDFCPEVAITWVEGEQVRVSMAASNHVVSSIKKRGIVDIPIRSHACLRK